MARGKKKTGKNTALRGRDEDDTANNSTLRAKDSVVRDYVVENARGANAAVVSTTGQIK